MLLALGFVLRGAVVWHRLVLPHFWDEFVAWTILGPFGVGDAHLGKPSVLSQWQWESGTERKTMNPVKT